MHNIGACNEDNPFSLKKQDTETIRRIRRNNISAIALMFGLVAVTPPILNPRITVQGFQMVAKEVQQILDSNSNKKNP